MLLKSSLIEKDAEMALKAQKYLDRKYTAYGEIKGRIEKVNIHDKQDFYLYLDLNKKAVLCHFKQDDLLNEVKASLGSIVIARGLLEYIGTDVDPTVATIEEIETAPDGFQPVTIDDLLGIAPNITNGTDVHEYIRKLRGVCGTPEDF